MQHSTGLQSKLCRKAEVAFLRWPDRERCQRADLDWRLMRNQVPCTCRDVAVGGFDRLAKVSQDVTEIFNADRETNKLRRGSR